MSAIQQALLSYGAAAPTGQTWNPADFSSEITLSGGNLVATRSSTNANLYRAGRAVQSISGKKYWEVTLNTMGAPEQPIGVANSGHGLSTYIGHDANGYGYSPSSGVLYNNAASLGTFPTSTSGDVIMFALDAATGKFWVGKNGTWFGTGNPGAGTGQQATASLTQFPALTQYTAGTQETANFSGAMTYSIPSGFSTF